MEIILMMLALMFAPTTATTAPATRPGGAIVPPEKRDVPGTRIDLSCGRIFVPDFFVRRDRCDLVMWFRGAPWCVEQEFYDARKNAVLFTWDEKKQPLGFKSSTQFDQLLDEIARALKEGKIDDEPIGRICLGSFSGGYVAVRDVLAMEKFRSMISDVVLADSLYPPRGVSDPNQLDKALAPFLEYARRASRGECGFWFSQLYPPRDEHRTNSTTVAANWLIDRVGATRALKSDPLGRRLLLYRADLKGFHVLGFAGMTNQDHFEHLYNLHDLLGETSLDPP